MHTIILCFLVSISFASLENQAHSNQTADSISDLKKLTEDLNQSWKAIESLEITSEDFPCETAQNPTTTSSTQITRTKMTLASGGRRAITISLLQNNHPPKHIKKITEDGKYSYSILPFPDDPDSINQIAITPQKNTSKKYDDIMNNFLWCFTPAGSSLATHIENGATLELDRDWAANKKAYLSFKHKGMTLTCELDRDHGWLPKRISTPGEEFVWEIQEFHRVAGIWFPKKGTHTIRNPKTNKSYSTCFQVTSLSVNGLPMNANFGLPDNSRGAIIKNTVLNKTYINGSELDREKLLAKHAPPDHFRPTQGLTVASQPPQSIWSWILGGVGIIAIATALALHLRNRNK